MAELTPRQMYSIVSRWIGVNGGYLGDFSYRSHADFYLDLDLDIDPNAMPGTTRQRFITILNGSPPDAQAKIIRGILTKYPVGSSEARTQELYDELDALASDRAGESRSRPIAPRPIGTSATVRHALRDAEHLLETGGAVSALDRVHTALHGYLRDVCREADVEFSQGASASTLLSTLTAGHPRLIDLGSRSDETRKTLRTLGATVDALGTLRNLASLAHANEDLVAEPEARLAVDAAYALVTYIEAWLRRSRATS